MEDGELGSGLGLGLGSLASMGDCAHTPKPYPNHITVIQ